jgi:hypothetical protein
VSAARTLRNVLLIAGVGASALAQTSVEARNMALISHNDLGGNGDGRERLAIQQWPDGRSLLYLAHEGQRTYLSIVDVTECATSAR